MTRKLTNQEIENMLSFVQPAEGIPEETAMSVVNITKENFRKQLRTQMVYPEIIPDLQKELERQYYQSLIQPGESVGVICAQSIGEKQTQTTLNSIDWKEKLLYTVKGSTVVETIGEMIDKLLEQNPDKITYIEENRTQYLPILESYHIPSCDENGLCKWYKIEAVTRHLPVGKLVKVTTASGRNVTATQSKSFLVWNGKKFVATPGSEVKVGDIMPTTQELPMPHIQHTYFDMETIFPKSEYLYTTELHKILKYKEEGMHYFSKISFEEHNGKEYTVPYNRYDTMMRKRKEYFLTCKPGLIYMHTSSKFVSHIPDKIPLDEDFGFFVGLYLSEGWVTKTFLGISNNDPVIRKRITDYCDRYGVTYHLVTSKGKNVRKGESNDLKVHSTLLARMFKIICDTDSANKKVPEFAYTAPREFIRGLIDGYYSGDGTVSKKDGSIIISSASEKLITGVSFLLSYFGIFGTMRNWQVQTNNVGSKHIKMTYTLRISNSFAQQFAREIPLTEDRKQKRLQTITLAKEYRYKAGRSQETFPERDVYFDEVVSVEYVEGTTEYVYDLTVESTRNFQLLNGLQLRDTFHTAGQSEKTMTSGVPRFQELINATKKPKMVNHTIYFNHGNSTIQQLRQVVGHSIAGLTLADVSTKITVELNKEDEPWYEAHKILFDDEFANHSHCVSFILDMKKLYTHRLTMQQIAEYIHSQYDDLFCVFSPPREARMDVFVDISNITLPENRLLFIDQDNAHMIYLEECVQYTLEKMYICGIPAITEVFYAKNGEEWFVETNGFNSKDISKQYSSFKKLLAHPSVDYTQTISNNVWDIYEVLDIEAARQFLIEEFMSIMEGINTCHTMLLVDRMTHAGTISSITRYTLKADESGPMGKASFEETMDNFKNAAEQGQSEPAKGVSASIICGKRAAIGTGMISVLIDIKRLPKTQYIKKNNEYRDDNKEDSENNNEDIPVFISI